MAHITTLIALVILSQTKPGPIDAFRANYSGIKVDTTFEYDPGQLEGSRRSVWEKKIEFSPEANSTGKMIGTWSCDGKTEHYLMSSPPDVLEKARKQKLVPVSGKVALEFMFLPKTEILWDGDILASHRHDRMSSSPDIDPAWIIINAIGVDMEPGVLTEGRGPFYWGFTYSFPQILKTQFAGVKPEKLVRDLDGIPVEFEVYRRGDPSSHCIQLEVAYDSSVGYLLRFARRIDYGSYKDAFVKEMYLVDATPCPAGGFVPTELLETVYVVSGFQERFKDYTGGEDLKPQSSGGGRLRLTSVKNRNDPVAMTDLKSVESLASVGGTVQIQRGTTSLSMNDIKSRLGRKLTDPYRPVLPTLDPIDLGEERHTVEREPTTVIRKVDIIVIILVFITLIIWFRRRSIRAANSGIKSLL